MTCSGDLDHGSGLTLFVSDPIESWPDNCVVRVFHEMAGGQDVEAIVITDPTDTGFLGISWHCD